MKFVSRPTDFDCVSKPPRTDQRPGNWPIPIPAPDSSPCGFYPLPPFPRTTTEGREHKAELGKLGLDARQTAHTDHRLDGAREVFVAAQQALLRLAGLDNGGPEARFVECGATLRLTASCTVAEGQAVLPRLLGDQRVDNFEDLGRGPAEAWQSEGHGVFWSDVR